MNLFQNGQATPNENNEFSILDSLNLISLMAQMQNMADDKIKTDYIHKVIQAISVEIEKLHKENDIIVKQNEDIIKLLKERY